MRKVKQLLLVCLTVFFVFVIFSGQSSKQQSKIFYVNLYNEPVDVRLGEAKDYVFIMDSLEPYQPTYMVTTEEYGEYYLYFKLSRDDKYFFWADDDENPIICEVEPNKTHCIVVGVDGTVEYFTLEEDTAKGPKVTFLNGTDGTLSRMEIGVEWNKETEAFTNNLEPDTITNFVTINKGAYSLFWQFPSLKKSNKYFYYPTEDGTEPEIFNFKNGYYYLFLAYTEERSDKAEIYDITPKK